MKNAENRYIGRDQAQAWWSRDRLRPFLFDEQFLIFLQAYCKFVIFYLLCPTLLKPFASPEKSTHYNHEN